MGGQLISKDEKTLVLQCRTKEEFLEKYVQKFGMPNKLYRIDNVWKQRKAIKEELVPTFGVASVTQPQKDKSRAEPLPDEGVILTSISHKLDDLIGIQKETLALFQKQIDKNKSDHKGGQDEQTGGISNS